MGKIVPDSGDLTNGMGLTAEGYPRGGFNGQAILPQPRLGFTWDMAGDRRTVLRGGFGISYDRWRSDVGAGSGATNQPFVYNPTLTNGYLQRDRRRAAAARSRPRRCRPSTPTASETAVYSYSLGIQRDLGKGIVRRRRLRRVADTPQPAPREPEPAPYGTTFQASAQDPTKTGGVVPAVEPGLPDGPS